MIMIWSFNYSFLTFNMEINKSSRVISVVSKKEDLQEKTIMRNVKMRAEAKNKTSLELMSLFRNELRIEFSCSVPLRERRKIIK